MWAFFCHIFDTILTQIWHNRGILLAINWQDFADISSHNCIRQWVVYCHNQGVKTMQIKTQDGMASVASAGVGGSALGVGIGGLALGLLNSANNGNGVLGGLFGGGSNQTNTLMSELAKEKAERFAEKTGAEIYNAMFSQYKELAQATTNIDKRVSALEVAGPLREQLLNQRIDCCCNSMSAGLAALQATVANITKTIVPITSVCPAPMPEFNSFVVPTAPATGA